MSRSAYFHRQARLEMEIKPSYDMRRVSLSEVRELFAQYHGYKSVGNNATYAFGVFENNKIIAAYIWQPPPPGAAQSICPESPQSVLALSRMVAVPKEERKLNHISKPLRRQMRIEIDRTRWPVLVTYSDESLGHTGHVYKCSGWHKTIRSRRPFYQNQNGERTSSYSCGKHNINGRGLVFCGYTIIQRWEHWACEHGKAKEHMETNWKRIPVENKVWRSGNPAFTFVKMKRIRAVIE